MSGGQKRRRMFAEAKAPAGVVPAASDPIPIDRAGVEAMRDVLVVAGHLDGIPFERASLAIVYSLR
jgi:hypothetical protein